MLLLLLTLTLGVADAGNLLYEVQQQEQLPPDDGYLCPDQASKCQYTATCCQLSSGQWGCCPFARATCCGDNVHCCPSGYMCNKDKEQCVKAINSDTMPWAKKEEAAAAVSESSSAFLPSESTQAAEKFPAYVVGESDEESLLNVKCDRTKYCQNKQTCCRQRSGKWKCCPRSKRCVSGRCYSNGFETEKWEEVSASTPAFLPSESTQAAEKLPAYVAGASDEEKATQSDLKVQCDLTHYCQNKQTCCRQRGGKWGCCPYKRSTCCYGSVYCCPRGQRCSNPPGRCYS